MDVGLRRIYPHIPLCLRPPDSRALTRVADVAARSRLRRAQGAEAPRLPWPLVQAPRLPRRSPRHRRLVKPRVQAWLCRMRCIELEPDRVRSAPSADSKPLLRPPPSAAVPTATASATKAPVAASAPSTNAWSMGNLAKDMAKTQQEEAERMHAQAQRTQQMALAAQQQFASTSPLQPSAQATAAAGRGQSTGSFTRCPELPS